MDTSFHNQFQSFSLKWAWSFFESSDRALRRVDKSSMLYAHLNSLSTRSVQKLMGLLGKRVHKLISYLSHLICSPLQVKCIHFNLLPRRSIQKLMHLLGKKVQKLMINLSSYHFASSGKMHKIFIKLYFSSQRKNEFRIHVGDKRSSVYKDM